MMISMQGMNSKIPTKALCGHSRCFHSRCSITDSQSSVDRYSTVTEDPIADAKEQNQRLLSAHVEKLKRGNLTASTQATLVSDLSCSVTFF